MIIIIAYYIDYNLYNMQQKDNAIIQEITYLHQKQYLAIAFSI